MKKLNRKGFTLVELLATIAILSIVSTVVIYVAINVVNKSRDKSYLVTRNNIEKMAVSYLEENSDKIRFVNYNDKIDYQCVTVNNLIDMNYFDKDILNSKIADNKKIDGNYNIYVSRDSNSKTITGSTLITNSDSEYNTLCGKYLERINGDIEFSIPGGYNKEKDILIKYCLYNVVDYSNIEYKYEYSPNDQHEFIKESEKDGCLVKEVKILDNGEIRAYVDGTDISKSTSINGIDKEAPKISILPNGESEYSKKKTIVINISDNLSGISKDSTLKYGFSKSKSEEPTSYTSVSINIDSNNNKKATVSINESKLTGEYYLWIKPKLIDNVGNSNNSTLISNVYKFDNEAPSIPTYIAKYRDGSGSYTSGNNANKEVVTEISSIDNDSGVEGIYYSKDKKNFIRFNFLVSNLKQNGNTWSGTESWDFRNGRDDSYYFRACDNVGNCSDVSELFNIKYVTQVYIKYNANGGSMASNHGSGYAVNSSGMITYNGEELVTKIEYGKKLGSSGLYNTNNSSSVNLVNGVYSIYSGREWCTGASGNGTCYSQDKQYSASDFCDASNKDCNVTLYANWLSYYCSYTGKTYATYSEAKSACTVTSSTNVLSKTTTTYSCPSGYTCSGGTCTSTSTCQKTVNGTITTKYYCLHNNSYQDSSTCSYSGTETAYIDLKCSNKKQECKISSYDCSRAFDKCSNGYDTCPSTWCTTSKCKKNLGAAKKTYTKTTKTCKRTSYTCSTKPTTETKNTNLCTCPASNSEFVSYYGKSTNPLMCNNNPQGRMVRCKYYNCPSGYTLTVDKAKCVKTGQSSCPSGYTKTAVYGFTSSTSSVSSCSTSSSFNCNSSKSGSSYVSNCSGPSYSCTSGSVANGTSSCYVYLNSYNGCSKGTVSGGKCVLTNQSKCDSGWTKTENKSCSNVGKYTTNGYSGCKSVSGSNFSCSSSSGSSCSLSGYSISRKQISTSGSSIGASCTSDKNDGATGTYSLTCSKTGTLRYYCSATGNYTDTKPSTCSSTQTENLVSESTTSYYCPEGYSSSGNLGQNSKCYKVDVIPVSERAF